MYVIGSYETYKVASNAFDQIIPIFDGNEDLKSVTGLLKTKYNRGHRYYCTYEFFMRHLVKHVRSDFATHLLDASFVNDLVTSSGSARAETLIEHNRSINAQCSTSQVQLENIVDQGLQSTSLKAIQPLIKPTIDVSTPRGVYIAKTSLTTEEGYNVAKIGKTIDMYRRGKEHWKDLPGFGIKHLEETKDEHILEYRMHTTFSNQQLTMNIGGHNHTELFAYQSEADFQQFIDTSVILNNNLKKLEGPNMEYERELTKRIKIEAPIKIAEVQAQAQVKLEELKTEQMRMKLELAKIEKGMRS